MRPHLFMLFWALPLWVFSQASVAVQQKALNAYVDYANQSADEINAVVRRVMDYYPAIHQERSWGAPRYTCPIQQDEYYYNTALEQGKGLATPVRVGMETKLKDLRAAADKIDLQCKALDTYHKLEDYKRDNFARAEQLVRQLVDLLNQYGDRQLALERELATAHARLVAGSEGSYKKAEFMMLSEIERERTLLDRWQYNLKSDIHTGWPVEQLEASILETDQQLKKLQRANLDLKYPASSMWKSFQGSLASVLEVKRNALDDYNDEARQSDKHSNDVYLSLINYFNGTLVSNYNMFVKYASGDGWSGQKSIHYFPRLTIDEEVQAATIADGPFKDIVRVPVSVPAQKTSISRSAYEALTNYVNFINETWRQTRYLQNVLRGFCSSAGYYRNLESFERRAGLTFDYKNFKLPLSAYQKAVAESGALPPTVAKTLNDQSTVLLNILREMNGHCAALDVETEEKRYEKDRLTFIFEVLARMEHLFAVWDDRKELLYQDLRTVYDAFPQQQTSNSWYVSGTALRDLTDADRDALFKAKSYYAGGQRPTIATDAIDEKVRDIIANEYDNMKGIQKIGRNNGLCPYTPYEDLPVTSRSLSDAFRELKPAAGTSSNNHPYHRMVYQYNDIVDDYNKFCTLSKDIMLLPTAKQPELFQLVVPEPVGRPAGTQTTTTAHDMVQPSVVTATTAASTANSGVTTTGATIIQHDTIYIERRDTVYLMDPGEDLRSMEGYAINNMVLLLDASGSMNTPQKLPLLKTSILQLVSMMRKEDEVSIIAFSDKPKALLTAASFTEEARIKKAINSLKPSGKTDGNQALKLAYKIADGNYQRGGNNRVILATDGQFGLSDETRELIEQYAREDIFLSVFNFGTGAGASQALENLAALGKGNYSPISPENVEIRLIREAKAKKQK